MRKKLTIALTAAIALTLILLRWGLTWMLPLAAAAAAVLIIIAVIDFDTQEIPDKFIIALIPLAIAAIWAQPHITLLSRGIGFLAVSAPMFAMALVINGAFGGGDIKLMAVCGFMLGWQHTLFAFFIALVLGTCWGLYLRAKGKNKRGEPIAFGPALCAGVYIALLYGGDAIAWYIDLLIF